MNDLTSTTDHPAPTTATPSPSLPRAVVALSRAELVKLLRVPAFAIPTLAFPTLFFAMFGLPNVGRTLAGVDAGAYLVVSYAAYSLLSVALFSFGVSVASERALGWSRLLRVTPMPPAAYLLAKVVAALVTGLATITVLVTFAALVGHVRFEAGVLALVVLKLLAGMTPFVALGLFLGFSVGPTAAAPVANLVVLPLAFMSGLFVPLSLGPAAIREIAPYSPAYHFAQVAWSTIGVRSSGAEVTHWLWLAGWGALFAGLALWAYRRDEDRRYG
ncbi:ABC transporter permease [Deinococcus pimensis]|uniref:ABC transporter permease n=1 Tax=Deinococcus pimensis TaxID=309888 RepID=UPI0004AE1FFE|nr:ABC transporter permease [Deinococcus pimensis]